MISYRKTEMFYRFGRRARPIYLELGKKGVALVQLGVVALVKLQHAAAPTTRAVDSRQGWQRAGQAAVAPAASCGR